MDSIALAALDLFPHVISGKPAAFRGFDALAINDISRRTGSSPFQFKAPHGQEMIDPGPQASIAPSIKISANRRDQRKVLGQNPPLATAATNIKDRIYHIAIFVVRGRPPDRAAARTVRSLPTLYRLNLLDSAVYPGYGEPERYCPKAYDPPSSHLKRLHQNLLISHNYF
ncbi:hypothetical protein SAMN04515647_1986 [Cohaesibacter sp. ES.047]|nr:hypothetical protein SAMN04515647_1986 [Cohaesibacter sp. ES.047]